MFFLMSGFVMQIGYAGKGPADGACCCDCNCCCDACCQGCGGTFARTFWARRVARLVPLAWVATLFYVPIAFYEQRPRFDKLAPPLQAVAVAEDAAATMSMFQTWMLVGGVGGVNGPLWTLCSQFTFYLIFPCTVDKLHYKRDSGNGGLLCPTVVNWLIYVGSWWLTCMFNLELYILAHIHPANKIPLFFIGMHFGSQV